MAAMTTDEWLAYLKDLHEAQMDIERAAAMAGANMAATGRPSKSGKRPSVKPRSHRSFRVRGKVSPEAIRDKMVTTVEAELEERLKA